MWLGVAEQGWGTGEALPQYPIPWFTPVHHINGTILLMYYEKGCKALHFSKTVFRCFIVNYIPEHEGSKMN